MANQNLLSNMGFQIRGTVALKLRKNLNFLAVDEAPQRAKLTKIGILFPSRLIMISILWTWVH